MIIDDSPSAFDVRFVFVMFVVIVQYHSARSKLRQQDFVHAELADEQADH